MPEDSKMPRDWALADSAIRLSVVCLVKLWHELKPENASFRLEKHLVKFPNAHLTTSPSSQLAITSELLMKVVQVYTPAYSAESALCESGVMSRTLSYQCPTSGV
jgi:hypothetical protein